VKKDKEKKIIKDVKDVKDAKEKKRKGSPTNVNVAPLKRGRKKTKLDDDDLVYLDDGNSNIYAKKYASKRSRNGDEDDEDEDGNQDDDDYYDNEDDDDDDDNFDDIQLSEQEKAKFENFVTLAMESGFFNGAHTDTDSSLFDSLQASMSATTTSSSASDSLDLLSSVSIIRAEKYKFDKNRILFGLGR
jgi:hypothetical protein